MNVSLIRLSLFPQHNTLTLLLLNSPWFTVFQEVKSNFHTKQEEHKETAGYWTTEYCITHVSSHHLISLCNAREKVYHQISIYQFLTHCTKNIKPRRLTMISISVKYNFMLQKLYLLDWRIIFKIWLCFSTQRSIYLRNTK